MKVLEIEKELACCGFRNLTDRPIPRNCTAVIHSSNPCYPSLQSIFKETNESMGIIGVALGLIELFAFSMATWFYVQAVRREVGTESERTRLLGRPDDGRD